MAERTGSAKQELSAFGTERVIPLRFVMMANDCNQNPGVLGCLHTPPQPWTTCDSCSDGTSGCGPDTASFTDIQKAVERANAALRVAGVQVYVSRVEKLKMPYFWNVLHVNDATTIAWSDPELRAQLKRLHPALTDGSFSQNPPVDAFRERDWLHAAAIRAGEPREIVITVAECSNGGDGSRPWVGASDFSGDRELIQSQRAFAHELGHVLGLEHTMYPERSSNPEMVADFGYGDATAGPIEDNWDNWDLVYGVDPSTGNNVYFGDRSAAFGWGAYFGQPLYTKHTYQGWMDSQVNCFAPPPSCTLTCELPKGSGKFQTIGDPGITGLGFTFPGDSPPSVYRRGINAMMYMARSQGFFSCPWTSFSESQAEQLKRMLRSDVRIAFPQVGSPYERGDTAKRHLLGDYRPRWAMERLDLDVESRRDLAVWQRPPDVGGSCGDGICSQTESNSTCTADCPPTCGDSYCNAPAPGPEWPPESSATCPKDCTGPDPCGDGVCGPSESPSACPTDCLSGCGNGFCGSGEPSVCPKDCGTFRALLSSSGYAGPAVEARLGRAGDVPVPADYDGDGYADFALLRRGGLMSENPVDSQFWWIWCKSAGNPSNPDCANFGFQGWGFQYDVPLPGLELDGNPATRELAVYRPSTRKVLWQVVGQSTWGEITLGGYGITIGKELVHLHGLYDSDTKTDLVVYEPQLARFYILTSGTNWNPAQPVVRYFSNALIPNAVGATDAGAGAPALRHGGVPLAAEKAGRRVLRVWDAYTATWHTMWDPLTSTSIQSIAYGAPRDVPLAGPIDRDADGRTDLVVFRPTMSPPTVFICSPAGRLNQCSAYYQFAVSGVTARSVVSAVPDISGDGRGDLVIVNPDQLTWRRFHSPNFVEQPTLALGDIGATIL